MCLKISFPVVEFQYIRREGMGCLKGVDLAVLDTNRASDYENCKQWCADNSDCGGFVIGIWNVCFFKATTCIGNLVEDGVNLYLKQIK